jgi:hypothetical protein
MSFESVKKSLANLRSIQEYDNIQDENRRLKIQLKKKDEEHEEQLTNLYRKIAIKDAELMSLREFKIKYKRKQYTPKQFDALIRREFNQKVITKIDEGVRKRWETEQQTLIEETLRMEIQQYPNSSFDFVNKIIVVKALKQRDILLKQPSLWPDWLKTEISADTERQVQELLDDIFQQRVEQQAQERIQELTQIEWPRYLNTRIMPICRSTLISLIRRINTTIDIQCHKCGLDMTVTLTPDDGARLVTQPIIYYPCLNPQCRGLFGQTKIQVTLGDVFYILSQRSIPYRKVTDENKIIN